MPPLPTAECALTSGCGVVFCVRRAVLSLILLCVMRPASSHFSSLRFEIGSCTVTTTNTTRWCGELGEVGEWTWTGFRLNEGNMTLNHHSAIALVGSSLVLADGLPRRQRQQRSLPLHHCRHWWHQLSSAAVGSASIRYEPASKRGLPPFRADASCLLCAPGVDDGKGWEETLLGEKIYPSAKVLLFPLSLLPSRAHAFSLRALFPERSTVT
jgi:hypothetical protein